MAWTSSTKESRWEASHTSGAIASEYARPKSMEPVCGRAFSSAWNSQVSAHFR